MSLLSRQQLRVPQRWRPPPPCPTVQPRAAFYTTTRRWQSEGGLPDHYATLSLPPTASPAEIKKQFYKLSKTHHPDLHPTDPTASEKFVQISEAYATLSSPDKRTTYDRDFHRSHGRSSGGGGGPAAGRTGSYSSASNANHHTGPGGRPASGLSRRRTQFRGPPPSFYAGGGWGAQGAKRSEHASQASHSHEAQGRAASGPAGPGVGPGGFTGGGMFEEEAATAHFDQRAHTQTHEELERTRHRARRQARDARIEELAREGGAGNSVAFNFFMITGLLTFVLGLSGAFAGADGGFGKRRQEG